MELGMALNLRLLVTQPKSEKKSPSGVDMVYQKRINEAKERMNRAEDALKGYTLSNPCNAEEHVRLSEQVIQARKEFINTLDGLAYGASRSTHFLFASRKAGSNQLTH